MDITGLRYLQARKGRFAAGLPFLQGKSIIELKLTDGILANILLGCHFFCKMIEYFVNFVT